jgi:glycerol-3-phosphate dehydrogenase
VRPRRLRASADPLPGAHQAGAGRALERLVDTSTAAHLLTLYGGEAGRVLSYADTEPEALEPIHADGPDIWAQAHFAVDEEMAVRAEDIAARRTTLGLRGLSSAQVLGELGHLVGSGSQTLEPA